MLNDWPYRRAKRFIGYGGHILRHFQCLNVLIALSEMMRRMRSPTWMGEEHAGSRLTSGQHNETID